jgi:protein involved in polysaccharide export with SLBB domain
MKALTTYFILLATLGCLARAEQNTEIPSASPEVPPRIRIPSIEVVPPAETSDNAEAESEQAALTLAAQAKGWVPRGSSGVLRSGMQVKVTVMIQGNMVHAPEPQRINESGKIGLPLLNNIEIADRSVEDIEVLITEAYKEFYKEPLVNVEFVGSVEDPSSSPWGFITLMGNVASPGPLAAPPTGNLTVSGALKKAGGMAASANKGSISIFRPLPDENRVERIKVDLDDLGRKGRHSEDVTLYAGDVVYIPERIF